jgi:hypothetical protein
LIGSPVAGTIIDVEADHFAGGYIFTGSLNVAAALILILARWVRIREKEQK